MQPGTDRTVCIFCFRSLTNSHEISPSFIILYFENSSILVSLYTTDLRLFFSAVPLKMGQLEYSREKESS